MNRADNDGEMGISLKHENPGFPRRYFSRQLPAALFSVWASYFITVSFIASWNFNNLFARDKKPAQCQKFVTIVEKKTRSLNAAAFCKLIPALEMEKIRLIKPGDGKNYALKLNRSFAILSTAILSPRCVPRSLN